MKTTLIAAALALTSAASFAMTTESAMTGPAKPSPVAFVNAESGPMYTATPSTVTRAQVLAELKASQARMGAVFRSGEDGPLTVSTSSKTVAEVRAEFVAARAQERMSARLHGYGDSSN